MNFLENINLVEEEMTDEDPLRIKQDMPPSHDRQQRGRGRQEEEKKGSEKEEEGKNQRCVYRG